jgi:hypothetical protein
MLAQPSLSRQIPVSSVDLTMDTKKALLHRTSENICLRSQK